MAGLYIFGVLIVVGIVVIIIMRMRWSKAAKVEISTREAKIENERIDELTKEEARAKK
jgi:flagellar biosynthesis/type III secretory pathway M-ring protein FliF/YscJ